MLKMSKGKVVTVVMGTIALAITGVIMASVIVAINAAPGSQLRPYIHKNTDMELGTDENPYTILEIVPDTECGTVGYLVKGNEPQNLLTIGVSNKEDDGTPANIYAKAFDSEKSHSSTVGDYSLSHIFMNDASALGDVDSSIFTTKKDEYVGETTQGEDRGFSEFGYYTKVDRRKGDYVYDTTKLCFVPATPYNYDSYDNYKWTSLGEFKHVGLGKVQEGQIACTRERYTGEVDAQGQEIERGFSYKNDGGTGNVGKSAYNYYYTPFGDFQWVPNNNYNNENIFVENSTSEQITQAVVGDKLYMTRTEDLYYEYLGSAIICNDKLIQEIVGDAKATALSYKTQVVTATPAELDMNSSDKNNVKELIDTADMIIIHDNSTGYRIVHALAGEQVSVEDAPFFKNRDGYKDLKPDTVKEIIDRGATGNPAAIVFDEKAIETAGQNGCAQLKLLYEVYNNIGAKLAYNWKYGESYTSKNETLKNDADDPKFNYRNFSYNEKDALGMSHFVYNFEGADSSGKKDDSWLTTGFADDNMISRSNLNASAFDNMGLRDNGSKMSVAKMLSAINKESNGYNQPKHLNILEIQPNEIFRYDNSTIDGRNSWIKYYLSIVPWFIGTSSMIDNDLTIDTQPTYEFIGKNVDLNEKYDLIVLGNKKQNETNGLMTLNYKGNEVEIKGYNDEDMPDTLAYQAVGDLVTTAPDNVKAARGGENSHEPYVAGMIYSGNDITKKKYDELINFSKQGPIIVDNNMYKADSDKYVVDPDVVDKSSFVYQLVNKNNNVSTINRYDNAADMNSSAHDIKNGIVDNRCSFTFIPVSQMDDGKPIEYEGKWNSQNEYKVEMNSNNQKDNQGNNILQYHIRIDGENNTGYGLELFLDNNGNGVFENSGVNYIEKVYNNDTENDVSESVTNLKIYDEDYKYYVTDNILYSGHTYLISSVLPPTQVGLIPWKLEIYNLYGAGRTNPLYPYAVRYSEEGYTRIENESNKINIDVLQINPQPDMRNDKTPYVVFDESRTYGGIFNIKSEVAKTFNKYAKELKDYSINVHFMENSEFYDSYNNNLQEWINYLNTFDMLIIGFRDEAKFTNNETFLAGFINFKNSGKPIILSHDIVEDSTFNKDINEYSFFGNNLGKDTSKYIQSDTKYFLRDISGQIRKYYNAVDVENNYKNSLFNNDYYYDTYWSMGNQYRLAWGDPNNKKDQYYHYNGFASEEIQTPNYEVRKYYADKEHKFANMIMDNSNRAMLYYNTARYSGSESWGRKYTFYDKLDRFVSKDYDYLVNGRNDLYWTSGTMETKKVQALNEGKITRYPCIVDDTMEIRNTHTQNYQLDLDYDNDGDVIVWYNLSGGIYDGRKQDARNNYYIYTKGNITYTGVGHYNGNFFEGGSAPALYPAEIRLFLNTMIAAYRSSPVRPYISVTNDDAVTNGNTTTMYMEDLEENGNPLFIQDKNIYYKIVDDTTNIDVKKTYTIKVYKGDSEEPIKVINDAQKGKTEFESIYYSDVKSKGEENLRIELYSDYTGKQNPTQPDWIQYVNISLMPMFDLR